MVRYNIKGGGAGAEANRVLCLGPHAPRARRQTFNALRRSPSHHTMHQAHSHTHTRGPSHVHRRRSCAFHRQAPPPPLRKPVGRPTPLDPYPTGPRGRHARSLIAHTLTHITRRTAHKSGFRASPHNASISNPRPSPHQQSSPARSCTSLTRHPPALPRRIRHPRMCGRPRI